MIEEKDKPEPLFKKGELVKTYPYMFINDNQNRQDGPCIILNSWWVSQEWSWVYDLYDPENCATSYSVIEALIRSYE